MFLNQLRVNLQFFSQDDTGGSNPSDENSDDAQDDTQEDQSDDKKDDKSKDEEPKFTQKQLDKIVQDRVERAEKDKEDAINEAKKLAKMTEQQKKDYEYEKMQRENAEYKAKLNRFELGKEATKILAESGITASDEILEIVVRDDAETTSAAVKAFSDLVDKVSDERMKEKLKGTSPKKRTNVTGAATKESIMAIKDGAERIKAIQENHHLFN